MLIGRVVGAERVCAGLALVPAKARERVRQTITALTMKVLRKVKAEKLSGQVLRNQTGTLRRSINQRVIEAPLGIEGSVGTNLRYGRFWELGFQGVQQVRAHIRKVKSRNTYEVEYKRKFTLDEDGDEVVTWRKGRRLASKGVGFVRAHTRNVNQAPRPFLRPVLEEMRDEIRARLEAAVRESLR